MSKFQYSDQEKDLNKVLKMNQDVSLALLNDSDMSLFRKKADDNIASSLELLRSLGKNKEIKKLSDEVSAKEKNRNIEKPVLEEWDEIVKRANTFIPTTVVLEDIMSASEISQAFSELNDINKEFSKTTSIVNKTDLSFLAIATGLQVAKSLVFPYIAKAFHYGDGFDKSKRLSHNDKAINDMHKKANDNFRDKNLKKHKTGHWINILYQTPAYDIT